MTEQNCQPHLERVGLQVPAVHVVAGTPMCQRCFSGRALRPVIEEAGGESRVIRPTVEERIAEVIQLHFVRSRRRRPPTLDKQSPNAVPCRSLKEPLRGWEFTATIWTRANHWT